MGFDISCGVRTLLTGLRRADIEPLKLAGSLFRQIPAGVGSKGKLDLVPAEMDVMLQGGARWAVERGYGSTGDLLRIEDNGLAAGALADAVSEKARTRQRQEMGTLGSGNHYLEVQEVVEVADDASALSLVSASIAVGHQIATDYQREMAIAMPQLGISVPDLDLACAPIRSQLGQRYLGAMRAAINCALANRQILTHLTRRVFGHFFPQASSICCSMFRTTPASRRRIVLQGASEVCLFTGRERHAPSARTIRSCRLRSGTSASRCSSAAAWAPTRRSWPAPAMGRNTTSHRHAMVPDVNSAAIRPWALARSSGHR